MKPFGCLICLIDEFTDVKRRFIVNVLIETSELYCPRKKCLIHFDVLEKVNHSTIFKLFDRTFHIIWSNWVQHENVLPFLRDASPQMAKAGNCFKVFYSKMVHVTCVAHALHRVVEEIRKYFPEIDQLISNGKKNIFKEN